MKVIRIHHKEKNLCDFKQFWDKKITRFFPIIDWYLQIFPNLLSSSEVKNFKNGNLTMFAIDPIKFFFLIFFGRLFFKQLIMKSWSLIEGSAHRPGRINNGLHFKAQTSRMEYSRPGLVRRRRTAVGRYHTFPKITRTFLVVS